MVCFIFLGVGLQLTDVQLVTSDISLFGCGNIGPLALQVFKERHVCSDFCRSVGLKGIPKEEYVALPKEVSDYYLPDLPEEEQVVVEEAAGPTKEPVSYRSILEKGHLMKYLLYYVHLAWLFGKGIVPRLM